MFVRMYIQPITVSEYMKRTVKMYSEVLKELKAQNLYK